MKAEKRPGDWIRQLMANAHEDSFWRNQLRSPSKIRQKCKEGKLDRFIPVEWITDAELSEQIKKAIERETMELADAVIS
jgi:hypothetical protein